MARSLTRRVAATEPDDDTYEPDETEDTQDAAAETEAPSRTRKLSEPAGSRRRRAPEPDDDDDYEDNGAPQRGRSSKRRSSSDDEPPKSSLGSGWDAHKKNKAKASKFNAEDQFKVAEGVEELIAFLDGKPFATYNEHGVGQGKSYRAYVCLGDDCPFCEIGDVPSYRSAFNVAVFDDDGNPTVKYWVATPGPLDEIEAHAFNERYAPLDKPGNYFVVSKKKKGNFTKYKVERITSEQVKDEFSFEPLTPKELTALKANKFEAKDAVRVKTRSELRDAVRESGD